MESEDRDKEEPPKPPPSTMTSSTTTLEKEKGPREMLQMFLKSAPFLKVCCMFIFDIRGVNPFFVLVDQLHRSALACKL